jgi:hypothetical protein
MKFSTLAQQKYRQRHMMWIIDEITNLLAQLRRWQTWLAIGLIGIFALLTFFVGSYAFRTDSLLIFLHRTNGACNELTNEVIIALFFGIIFFFFSALLTLGEFQRYVQFKARAAHYQARRALYWGIGWGMFAITLSAVALVFFSRYCR